MGKGPKKRPPKAALSAGLLDVAAVTLKKFRRVTKQVRHLSTTHKVFGGMALLGVGLAYLVSRPQEAQGAAPADLIGGATDAPGGPPVQPTATASIPLGAAGKSHRKKPTGPG
ncbi:MAG: hypothetical protein NVS3B25_30860 [Hymenobacter sp.]